MQTVLLSCDEWNQKEYQVCLASGSVVKTDLRVAVIDDDPRIYDEWKQLNPDVVFDIHVSFDQFFLRIENTKDGANVYDLILVDYYFDRVKSNLSLGTQEYLDALRDHFGYVGPVALVSRSGKIVDGVDSTFDRNPRSIYEILQSCLPAYDKRLAVGTGLYVRV